MSESTAIAVLCGVNASPKLIEVAKKLCENQIRIAVLLSHSIEQALVAAEVPHISVQNPTDVGILLSDRIELVLAEFQAIKCVKKEDYKMIDAWMNGSCAFLRTAAWNHQRITVMLDPNEFDVVPTKIAKDGRLTFSKQENKHYAESAFRAFAEMDQAISIAIADENLKVHDVLVVGNGGREHAIAWKLSQSVSTGNIYVAPGNAGTAMASDIDVTNVNISIHEHERLVKFAVEKNISLCVIGPEAPLVAGLADKMNAVGILAFGPSAKAAQLEASKAFAKDFMQRNSIPTAQYQNFTDYNEAKEYLDKVNHSVVIKASGIAAGKGVVIPNSKIEAHSALREIMVDKVFGDAGDEVVVEEFLTGEEVSLLAFSDGEHVVTMPGVQDHKRVFDDDQGPNTGGMGVFCPAPCLTRALEVECVQIIERVILSMKKEGMPYVGVLYPGFILTPVGPKVLEFNCRFGDPETQVLLPLLQSDLFEVMQACVQGQLDPSLVAWRNSAAAAVVLASGGYPNSYSKGESITGLKQGNDNDVVIFHAGTSIDQVSGNIVTSGGRVLAVSALASNLESAILRAYARSRKVEFKGKQYRSDIGLKGLLYTAKPIRIAVLGSTRGSSMQPIIDAIQTGQLAASIQIVISNKASAVILERAKSQNIEAVHLSCVGKSREDFDDEVSHVLEAKKVDLVLLIGYMRILSGKFCKQWKGKVLNVHPSLLPAFAGGMDLAVHQAVLDARKSESGCTIHFVTEQVDAGPIVVQMRCPVYPDDSSELLKARVQALEGKAFLHAIKLFQTGMCRPMLEEKGMITYATAGVDIEAGNKLVELIKPFCKSTIRAGCDANLGGFGGLFDLSAAGYSSDTVLVACTDGVGTKLRIATETKMHDTIGIDLVAMCVNDLLVQGAEPLFFLDYYACGKLEVEEAAQVVKGIAEGCRQSGCSLVGGETAEMPSMYHGKDYDLAGFCVGAVRKPDILPRRVQEGFLVLGLASSGVHSNGYSLVRKLVEMVGLNYSDPCPFPSSSKTLGEELMKPTRIYVKHLLPLIRQRLVHAFAHITGGGLLENIPRVLEKSLAVELDCSRWTLSPLFKWIRETANLSKEELARTFNCGIGMVLLVAPENAVQVTDLLKAHGENAMHLGKVVRRQGEQEQVILRGTLD
ncbi:unnamed protein product [Albugo candida]|uniref:Trifunctional purine biosynthetic protein adenosine-3 n=1 Tax=Albugo candida TaxID=65357 RepID=A0A024GLZ8_9STRA|nr:unnamed protein product [Albugo candida]|eukprot:CCI47357.1 unnamed protein product [Albugo candida]